MSKTLKLLSVSGFLFVVLQGAGCASKPILEKKEITVTRDEPSSSCHDLGSIEGRVMTVKGTQEQALENLKDEAVKKGANWVKIYTVGAQGTTVRGQAYHCH